MLMRAGMICSSGRMLRQRISGIQAVRKEVPVTRTYWLYGTGRLVW